MPQDAAADRQNHRPMPCDERLENLRIAVHEEPLKLSVRQFPAILQEGEPAEIPHNPALDVLPIPR
jgi:hypothetical protein